MLQTREKQLNMKNCSFKLNILQYVILLLVFLFQDKNTHEGN